MMHRLISLSAISALLIGSAALAGQPDDPGVHGGIVSEATKDHKANGTNLGQAIKDYREDFDPDYKLGEQVQSLKEGLGGAPNPDNDNGSGND
ncbi:hypothetical protein [Falsihalocynthiibacter sp. CO-5D18]|uniref:hypothetical protein n=1 Tax=Falsihalocynthiibacter sp. CO-5D18 TaxID=3240872 RepID=UPI0035103A99